MRCSERQSRLLEPICLTSVADTGGTIGKMSMLSPIKAGTNVAACKDETIITGKLQFGLQYNIDATVDRYEIAANNKLELNCDLVSRG